MSAPDLTILFLTVNKVPRRWAEFQIDHLRKAAGDLPIISISRLPMDLGTNVIQPGPSATGTSTWRCCAGA